MITDPKDLAEHARKSLQAEPHPRFGLVDHLDASRDAGDLALAEIALRLLGGPGRPIRRFLPARSFILSVLINGLLEVLNNRRPGWMGYGVEYPQ